MNNSYSGYGYNHNVSSFKPSLYQQPGVQSSGIQGSNMYVPYNSHSSDNDNRLIGAGFAFPFLLGGVTGAAIAPAFWRPPYNRPYGPGPFYGPGYYYGPYRSF